MNACISLPIQFSDFVFSYVNGCTVIFSLIEKCD